MEYSASERVIESLRLAILTAYANRPVAPRGAVRKALTTTPELTKEARENVLCDVVRAAVRMATMELFPGDQTCLEPNRAWHAVTEAGVSGLVRQCDIGDVDSLKDGLSDGIRGMEVTTNNGRPLAARFRRRWA